jgi:hypothetical protein
MARLMASTSSAPKGPRLQGGDLGLQQLLREQHLAEPRLQPPALQRLAVGGPGRKTRLARGQERIAPAGQRRRGDAERARDRLQVLAAQQTQHGITLALARHPPATARTRSARRPCRHRHLSADNVR